MIMKYLHFSLYFIFIFLILTKYITCFSSQQNIEAKNTKWHLKSFSLEIYIVSHGVSVCHLFGNLNISVLTLGTASR